MPCKKGFYGLGRWLGEAKRLLWKQEDLSSDPQTLCKMRSVACACNPSTVCRVGWGQKPADLGTCWPASTVKMSSSGFSERLSTVKK